MRRLQLALAGGHDKTVQKLLDNAEGFDNARRVAFAAGDDRRLGLLRKHDPAFRGNIGH